MTIPYHTPDSTWEAWDCYTFGQFISKFLVKGVFHPNVPEDVVKSYLIVEHMVAHAWYYYPAMDEALSKALLITEMAVKLRCRELGLQTSIKSVNGKILDVKLAKLTDQLLQLEPDKDIEHLLHWARINRNRIAHPNQHSYGMGIMVNFKFVVSLLNLLFLTNEAVKNQITQRFNNSDMFSNSKNMNIFDQIIGKIVTNEQAEMGRLNDMKPYIK